MLLEKLHSYDRRAQAVASDSHDSETKVGALLINKESGAVISDGYNGFVRGAPDAKLPSTRPEKYNFFQHSELNMLCNAVRHGVSTKNCIVYVTLSPCTKCLRMLWQAGIDEIYFKDVYKDFETSVNMGDLIVETGKIGEYTKISISPVE